MPRDLADIKSDQREAHERAMRLHSELEGLRARMKSGENGDGIRKRAEDTETALRKAFERHAELTIEERDTIHDGLKSGRYSTEHGADGASAGEHAMKSGQVDQARRRIDALVKSKAIPEHGAANGESLLLTAKGADLGVAARWTLAAGDPAYKSAFMKMCGDPDRGHLLWSPAEHAAYKAAAGVQSEMKAMAELAGPTGGFLVPFELDPTIMLTTDGSVNPLRQISRVVRTVTDKWHGVTSEGVTSEWLEEAQEASETTPDLESPMIRSHKLGTFVPYSYELEDDAVGLGLQLQRLMVDAADQAQAEAFLNGTGVHQPRGLTTALPAASRIAAGTAGEIGAADVVKLQNALGPRWQPRASWLANLSSLNAVGALETGNGAIRFPELGGGQLLRKPVVEASRLGSAGEGDDPASTIVYGDFQQFVITDRIGTTVEFIPNLLGPNRRPTGQRGLFMWLRTGSDVVIPAAFRMLTT